MNFITDRTEEDVLLQRPKGFYLYSDLNRVEKAVQQLCEYAAQLGMQFELETKTDWKRLDIYNAETWPTNTQMARFLQNIKTVCTAFDVNLPLPYSLENLDWEGANQIEIALQAAFCVATDRLQL